MRITDMLAGIGSKILSDSRSSCSDDELFAEVDEDVEEDDDENAEEECHQGSVLRLCWPGKKVRGSLSFAT